MEARRGRRRRERTGTRQRRRARRREKRRGRGNDGDVTRGVPVLGLERHGRGGGASTAASSRFARVQRLSGKSAPRVRCERRARGPVTAPNAPSARPLRASPRVSSSARAALPRPQARPRVPRATRPPTRVTSKKRRDALKSPSARTNVSLGTVDKPKIASGFERERRFIGKIRNVPPFAEQRSAFEAHERSIDSIKIAARVGLRAERPTPLAFRCIHKKAS